MAFSSMKIDNWLPQQGIAENSFSERRIIFENPSLSGILLDSQKLSYYSEEALGTLDAWESLPLEKLDLVKGCQVLEIGATDGSIAALLSREEQISEIHSLHWHSRYFEHHLPFALSKMEGRAEKVKGIKAAPFPLLCENGTYDLILLHGIPTDSDSLNFLRELRRAISSTGCLVVFNQPISTLEKWAESFVTNVQTSLQRLASNIPADHYHYNQPALEPTNQIHSKLFRSEVHWLLDLSRAEFDSRIIETNNTPALQLHPEQRWVHFIGKPREGIEQPAGWLSDSDRAIITAAQPYTMTTPSRLLCLIQAVDHILDHAISGSFVECGVWKGGSMMAAALSLLRRGENTRDLYLYDTFDGMPPPTEKDTDRNGVLAQTYLDQHQKDKESHYWCYSPIEDVRGNLAKTHYPDSRLHFVKGKVEDTIPNTIPTSIALLRLDTDWYESTIHELNHLYPLVSKGGILIIDDYGCWSGSKEAVDEYFSKLTPTPELHPIDDEAYYAVKQND